MHEQNPAPLPDHDALIALTLGELDESAAAALRQRIAADPQLGAALQRIEVVIEELRAGPLPEVPAAAIRRAKAITAPAEPLPGMTQRLAQALATLIFDSRSTTAMLGFRGGLATEFHLTFHSELGEIDLQIQPGTAGGNTRVLGQVDCGQRASQALLRQGNQPTCESSIDEQGMFRLEAPPYIYELIIILENGLVRIPSLDLA